MQGLKVVNPKFRCAVAIAAVTMLFVGQARAAQGLDLGALLAPLQPVQQANVPTDLEVAPRVAGMTHVVVADPTSEKPGTITVDTKNRWLYLSMDGGQAMRYDIGVGRDGFAWSGEAYIGRRAEWPTWTPPADMLKRRPDIPHFMKGGIDNPLGARAMYLYNAKGDTMFRIHGTNEPDTIGQAVSSGCIRLLNADVIDLYDRVKVGAHVVVL
jgi:lipoprotein-anchoring transpeptidase ErfK/SrfK